METDFGPALEAAYHALETGSLRGVYAVLDEAIRHGVTERYHAVEVSRERAAYEGSVAVNRERAEAELLFEKYVYELYPAALGQAPSAEGGHAHESAGH